MNKASVVAMIAASVAGVGSLIWYIVRGVPGTDANSIEEVSTTVDKLPIPRAGGAGGGSSASTPLSIRNNNPTNLRFISANPFNGQTGNNGGFGVYSSAALGVRAAFLNLYNYFRAARTTAREIVSAWAPSSENPTAAYVDFVANWIRETADTELDFSTHAVKIIQAMARFETGFEAWPLSFFQQGKQDSGK